MLETILPPPERLGRKRSVDLREICSALCYLNRAGCQWRMLPEGFPPWQTVYYYFRLWRDSQWFIVLNEQFRREVRVKAGREDEASAAIIDAQSVKTDEQADCSGFDAGKKSQGTQTSYFGGHFRFVVDGGGVDRRYSRPGRGKGFVFEDQRSDAAFIFDLGGWRLSR